MGYTGSVTFNGEDIFTEWKSNNTYFCMDYPITFMRSKPCLLTVDAIDKSMQNIHHGATGYGAIAYELKVVMDVIYALTGLIDGYAGEHLFDGENFVGVIKMQNIDTYGNSKDINFYYKDRVSDVPSVRLDERITVSEKDINDMKMDRISHIPVINISSAFGSLSNARNRYHDTLNRIMNIKTRADIFALVSIMQDVYNEWYTKYDKAYKVAMQLTEHLLPLKQNVERGEEVYVWYEDKMLHITSAQSSCGFKVDDFFTVCELFKKNGIESFGAGFSTSDKKVLSEFIKSFKLNEKRAEFLERKIINIYNHLENGEQFTFSIGGGF